MGKKVPFNRTAIYRNLLRRSYTSTMLLKRKEAMLQMRKDLGSRVRSVDGWGEHGPCEREREREKVNTKLRGR